MTERRANFCCTRRCWRMLQRAKGVGAGKRMYAKGLLCVCVRQAPAHLGTKMQFWLAAVCSGVYTLYAHISQIDTRVFVCGVFMGNSREPGIQAQQHNVWRARAVGPTSSIQTRLR